MSNVYATEPATSGRVIFETTHGPLDIQLWCRECPETTRFFLQLCMDGFYDNMVFHRIIPSFLIQTGALRQPPVNVKDEDLEKYRTNTQATRALERRKYEVHSRIHFNHRGQVAMALGVDDEEDEEIHPQFFITLDETSHLDGKHVLFGTVVGPTLFNAIRIGQTDVDEKTNLPAGELSYAPRVTSVKIVENPIHTSIAPQVVVPWHVRQEKDSPKRKRKRKGKRDMNVLSFGDEMEDEMDTAEVGIKSSHDVLQSKKLSRNVDVAVKETLSKETTDSYKSVKKMKVKEEISVTESSPDNLLTAFSSDVVAKLEKDADEVAHDNHQHDQPALSAENTEDRIDELASSLDSSHNRKDHKESHTKDVSHEHENLLENRRAKYAKSRKSKKERENETIEKLFAFRNKVQSNKKTEPSFESRITDNSLASRMAQRAQESSLPASMDTAPTYHGQVLDSDDEKPGSDWLRTKFKCRRHRDLSSREEQDIQIGGDGRRIDEYEVLDERKRDRHHKSKREKSHKKHKEKDRKSRH